MASRNCATSLRRRARSDTMLGYDLLPPDVRQWLSSAVLPWSAASVRRAWSKALKSAQGDRQTALNALERQRLEKKRRPRLGDDASFPHPAHPKPSLKRGKLAEGRREHREDQVPFPPKWFAAHNAYTPWILAPSDRSEAIANHSGLYLDVVQAV